MCLFLIIFNCFSIYNYSSIIFDNSTEIMTRYKVEKSSDYLSNAIDNNITTMIKIKNIYYICSFNDKYHYKFDELVKECLDKDFWIKWNQEINKNSKYVKDGGYYGR